MVVKGCEPADSFGSRLHWAVLLNVAWLDTVVAVVIVVAASVFPRVCAATTLFGGVVIHLAVRALVDDLGDSGWRTVAAVASSRSAGTSIFRLLLGSDLVQKDLVLFELVELAE